MWIYLGPQKLPRHRMPRHYIFFLLWDTEWAYGIHFVLFFLLTWIEKKSIQGSHSPPLNDMSGTANVTRASDLSFAAEGHFVRVLVFECGSYARHIDGSLFKPCVRRSNFKRALRGARDEFPAHCCVFISFIVPVQEPHGTTAKSLTTKVQPSATWPHHDSSSISTIPLITHTKMYDRTLINVRGDDYRRISRLVFPRTMAGRQKRHLFLLTSYSLTPQSDWK